MICKMYDDANEASYQREIEVAKVIGSHPNIIQIEQSFSFHDADTTNTYHCLVMPIYPRSAGDLLHACIKRGVPVEIVNVIAKHIKSALSHIHERNMCFADCKPDNIMLDGAKGCAILVDLGSVVPIGSELIERTPMLALDLSPTRGSAILDFVCLASTICLLLNIRVEGATRHSLLQDVCERERFSSQNVALTIAAECLKNSLDAE